MKKKVFSLILTVLMLTLMFTGCIHNDIGVKLKKDGTGSVSATIGIEKDFYNQLEQMGSDPFEGKDTIEYTYDDTVYVAYNEVKEYSSYEEMEKALLEMSYDTEALESTQNTQDTEGMNTVQDAFLSSKDTVTDEQDSRIFSSVDIEKNSGIFYSSYTFKAVLNPQVNTELQQDTNDVLKLTLTVEMPEKITQHKGGEVDGKTITFNVTDITEGQEFAAACEANNSGVVIGILVGLIALVAAFFFIAKINK